MKKDGKYRFSLQFSSDTPENMQIGELLERLGNKKSRVIISALTEYLQKHPQLSEESCKIEIRATGYDWEKVEEFIRKLMVENYFYPEKVYLNEVADIINTFPVKERIVVCESIKNIVESVDYIIHSTKR